MMHYVYWKHGTVTDPKFKWVACRSNQRLGDVLAVYAALLEHASFAEKYDQDAKKGNLSSFDCSNFDVLFGLNDGSAQKIYDAMIEKNLIQKVREE